MNAIVIVCDTLRMDDLGFFGGQVAKTPNFDSLAADSATFSRYYAEGLPTVPVRTAYFTGRYTLPYRPWQPLESADVPIAELLWDKGYASALITDTYHLHKPQMSFGRGFDHVEWIRGREDDPWIAPETVTTELDVDKYYTPPPDGNTAPPWGSPQMLAKYMRNRAPWAGENGWLRAEDHFEAQVVQRGIDWLTRQLALKRKDRLFLWLDIFAPHDPIDPPPPYDRMYTRKGSECKDLIMPLVRAVDGYLTEEQLDHVRRLRWGFITFIDVWVGKLIGWLRTTGMLDNTLLIWTTDHGDFFGEHGIIEKCRPWSYEVISHIPLLIRHPRGLGRGQTFDAFAQTPDIMPTILEALGVELPACVQGKSLLPLMQGKVKSYRDYAISGWYNTSWSIRDRQWSYHMWLNEKASKTGGPELYNLVADPDENNNVIDRHGDIAKKLDKELRKQMASLADQEC